MIGGEIFYRFKFKRKGSAVYVKAVNNVPQETGNSRLEFRNEQVTQDLPLWENSIISVKTVF